MKKPHYWLASFLTLLFIGCTVFAGSSQQSEPQRLIESVKLLEEKPLDKEAKGVRAWAVEWVIATDKVNVKVCALILGVDKKYKYSSELISQYTVAMAAFKLANPDKANDEDAAQLAGIESAITVYKAIQNSQPKAKNGFMDSLVTKSADGSLAQFVMENNCKDKR